MAIVEIPVRSDLGPHEFTIVLDNETFNFSFYYNDSAQRWNMTISDNNNQVIARNIRLYTDTDITYQLRHLNIPKGLFLIVDGLNQQLNPTQDAWNDTHFFMYNEV